MTNERYLVSRNKREGWYWHGLDNAGKFKMRMHEIDGDRTSLREYGKYSKKMDKHLKGKP